MDTFEPVEILLVEDNPNDAELMIRALEQAGLANKVRWAKDGQEALDFLSYDRTSADDDDFLPRLILLDLNMPRLSGMELLEKIKRNDRTKSIPVVVITSSNEETDVARS